MTKLNPYIPKIEPGLLSKRGIYFSETTDLAKKLYFYVFWCGEYFVEAPYSINRNYMDSFIIFWVKTGKMQFIYHGKSFQAPENSIVLLDCKEQNQYFVQEKTNFQFIHFNGEQVPAFYETLTEKNNFIHQLPKEKNTIPAIIELLENKSSNDLEISLKLYQLLGSLVEKNHRDSLRHFTTSKYPASIKRAIAYINEHYREKISVASLSQISNLSPHYFSRLFKKHTGNSPHQYLLQLRLHQAKNLLVQTEWAIEEISDYCGFYNVAHFIRLFAQSNGGLTPGKFRKSHF